MGENCSQFQPLGVDRGRSTTYSGHMSNSKRDEITGLAQVFLRPANATHRRYEALRAYFVDKLPSAEAARRFGYSPGSFRVLCHQFRHHPDRPFFLPPDKGPKTAPKMDRVRQEVIALRKQNLSIYDISRTLEHAGQPIMGIQASGRICVSDLAVEGQPPPADAPGLEVWAEWLIGACGKREYLGVMEQAGFKDIDVVAEYPYSGPGMVPELAGKIVGLQLKAMK
jgi:hypothetical protein